MPSPEVVTNYNDSDGVDLGKKLISKDYLISVYPQIADQLITPELWIWGGNSYGELGTNDTTDRSTPVTTFAGGSNWKSVSGGSSHTSAIKTDGTLWVWGGNRFGEAGVNSLYGSGAALPTPVTTFAGGTNWKQVDYGGFHQSAIKTDGTLWTWGLNIHNSQIQVPTEEFGGSTNWKQVSASQRYFRAAIKTDGTLWTWGENAYTNGVLGTNDTTNRSTPVTTFAGGTNWKQVSCGTAHIAAIKTDGTLLTWGRNTNGQLGVNDTTNRSTPVPTFDGGTNWKQVSTGGGHTIAIKTDGTLWTWGSNGSGQLGVNDTTNRNTPVTTFAGGTNWKQVSCNSSHTAAIKTDGTLWTWGNNTYGQLGINDTTQRNTPVTTFAGGTNWKQVSTGGGHTIAIKTSDDLIGI
jgi:alpha-tubulin suppressor-like RCC1 family protein